MAAAAGEDDQRRTPPSDREALSPALADLLLETTAFVTHLLQDHTVLELFEVCHLLEARRRAGRTRISFAATGRSRVTT